MIPKILHQIWLGNQSTRPVTWMDSWKDKHPDWKYMLWTEDNISPLVYESVAFKNCPTYSGKSDILRYILLWEFGGVYIDADSECLEPIDDLLNVEAFCSWENEYVTTGLMLGAFMGSTPKNKFFKDICTAVEEVKDFDPEWFTVGPGLLTKMVGQLKYQNMIIYPSHYFSPTHHTGLQYKGKDKVYANHFWGSTPKLTSTITKEGFTYEKR